jgi:glycine/D-amino acid oxidase-like deaminating enzyme
VLPGTDVVVIGGGIIGAACADGLAASGAAVVLLERDVLAAGASGRNQGLFVTPSDPHLLPMAQSSLDVYLRIDDESPLQVGFDREPIGFLRIAEGPGELEGLEEQARAPSDTPASRSTGWTASGCSGSSRASQRTSQGAACSIPVVDSIPRA